MAGDMEFKQNKFLPAEKQVVTCNPDVNTVSISHRSMYRSAARPVHTGRYGPYRSVELCDDDEFLILACDGVWYAFSAPL
ncbi:hypothetical protein BHM03_00010099 [Ensete ventricosum]|nr:hypothetical protein BHM03_00010099 [Ensete ventricosum]